MSLREFYSNRYLAALLEADNTPKKRKGKSSNTDDADDTAQGEETADAAEESDTTTGEDGTSGDESDTEGTEEKSGSDEDAESGSEEEASEEEQSNEETDPESTDEGSENEDENSPEEGDGEDDFSLDPEGGEEGSDNDPPPDGLTDPDDDGSSDDSSDNSQEETNVQTNILNMSKLDRLLAKRRCLTDYHDLRTSINSFRNTIEKSEAILEPTIRDETIRDLNTLYTRIGEYLMYRFGYNNYEENLQNYFIFMQSMNEIIKKVDENGPKAKKNS